MPAATPLPGDGTVTVEDRKKFSLRAGATSAGVPAVAGSIPGDRMSDAEMINEIGYCHGIENYARWFSGREGIRGFLEGYSMLPDWGWRSIPTTANENGPSRWTCRGGRGRTPDRESQVRISPLEGKRFEPSVPQEERFCEQTSSSPPAGKIV